MNVAAPVLSALVLIFGCAPVKASDMDRRLREQERQISKLETENSQLRWLVHRRGIEIDDPDLLRPADKSHPEVPSSGARAHLVKKGESLSEIARQAGTTPEHLATLNKLPNPQLIQIGQRLRLPDPGQAPRQIVQAPPSSLATHIVAPGENLYRIALKHSMPLDQLLKENPGVDPHTLQIGQKIKVSSYSQQATESTGEEASPVS